MMLAFGHWAVPRFSAIIRRQAGIAGQLATQ
jgi:hypothetical protein